jgi:hypothetical protein
MRRRRSGRTGRRHVREAFGWIALLDVPRAGAVPVLDAGDGRPVGYLLCAVSRGKPDRSAVRVEPTLIGNGPALAVSLVLPPCGARPLFDDPAVVGAAREVLRNPARTSLFSTLVAGPTEWAGSVSGISPAVAAAHPAWWDEDPFARLGPQYRLLVPPGALVPRSLPVGPGHQRYVGAPWPWGEFDGKRRGGT